MQKDCNGKLLLYRSSLSYNDLNLHPALVTNRAFSSPEKAPCTFINVYECDLFTVTIFILRTGYTMPIHDHPGITGILKVVAGHIQLQSYTKRSKDSGGIQKIKLGQHVEVKPEELLTLGTNNGVAILTPTERNYHEMSAVGDEPAAFIDILSPPYEEGPGSVRNCSYYRRVLAGNKAYLEKVPAPYSYYCDSLYYQLQEEDTTSSLN